MVILGLFASVFLCGCDEQTEQPNEPAEPPAAEGPQKPAEPVTWILPLPPDSGLEKPRILTQEEKDIIIEIALDTPELEKILKTRKIKKIEFWWLGYPGWNYPHESVEKGIPPTSPPKQQAGYPENLAYYPAVTIHFIEDISPRNYTVGVDIVTKEVVYKTPGGVDIPRKKIN